MCDDAEVPALGASAMNPTHLDRRALGRASLGLAGGALATSAAPAAEPAPAPRPVRGRLKLVGVPRTARTPGRGGSSYSTWKLADAKKLAEGKTRAGRVTADDYWERITYFLERVVPVAEEHKVRLACHPQDPGLSAGFQG